MMFDSVRPARPSRPGQRVRARRELRDAVTAAARRVTPERLRLLRQMRRAIEREELEVHFQPKAILDSGQIFGCEALVRWRHPERGLLAPASFLPLLAETDAMRALSRYVLEQALRTQREWADRGVATTVQVNLSTRDLADETLVDDVRHLLRTTGVEPAGLGLEITEEGVLGDVERSCTTVRDLTEAGIVVALDDFGTGYSSMARLRELPISEIKIDRSFVGPMLDDEDCRSIVRATIHLAHDLGKVVVAEGVEDEATHDTLREMGCDRLQGYWLARPMPADETFAWLVRRDSAASPRVLPPRAAPRPAVPR